MEVLMTTNHHADDFAGFVSLMFAPQDGLGEGTVGVNLSEMMILFEAAHRAGGFTQEVLLKHTPASFREGGINAHLPAFLELWRALMHATTLYTYTSLPQLGTGVDKGVTKSDTVASSPPSKRTGSKLNQLIQKLGGGDVAKALTELDRLKTLHNNWEGVAVHLGSLNEDAKIDIKGGTLGALISGMRKQVREGRQPGLGKA
ncbi:hypothetical protein ACFL0L_02825 [Patescibacteria group bacterium]